MAYIEYNSSYTKEQREASIGNAKDSESIIASIGLTSDDIDAITSSNSHDSENPFATIDDISLSTLGAAPIEHTHVQSDITGLTASLSGKQPIDGDLTAIAALSGTSGLARKTASETWELDTNVYITGNQSITLSGDVTGSGTTSITTTLANSGVSAASYGSASAVAVVTFDAKGRATSASSTSIQIAESQVTDLTTDLASKLPASSVSGTTNKIARFTGSATLGDSNIEDTSVKLEVSNDAPGWATFGSELLAGTWTLGTGWSGDNTSGFAHATGNTETLSEDTAYTVDKAYKVEYTITGRTAGSITITAGGKSKSGITASGNFQKRFLATTNVVITPTSDFDGTIVFSLKEIEPYDPAFSLVSSNSGKALDFRLGTGSVGSPSIGFGSGSYITQSGSGGGNFALGAYAGQYMTTAEYCVFIGPVAGRYCDEGFSCVGIGLQALANIGGGQNCLAIGTFASHQAKEVSFRTALGSYAAYGNVSGDNVTAIGPYSLFSNTSGSNITAIGPYSGYYQMGSDFVIIDSFGQRASESDENANALIKGTCSASAADQTLLLNAVTTDYSHRSRQTSVGTSSDLTNTSTGTIVVTAGSVTLTLPASPEDNLEYTIVCRNNAPTIAGNGNNIFYLSSTAAASINVANTVSAVRLVWDGTYWNAF